MTKNKKNNKPKQSQPRQQKKQGRRTRNNRNIIVNPSRGIGTKICAVTNPFCPQAYGAKWPDESAAFSLPITAQGSFTLTTDTNGAASALVLPTFPNGYSIGTVSSGVATYATLTPFDGLADDTFTSLAQWRLVSGGVSATPITSMSTSQGLVQMSEYSSPSNADITQTGIQSLNVQSYVRESLKNNQPVSGTFRPQGPTSRSFQTPDLTTALNNANTADWSYIGVHVFGAAVSTPAVQVDYVLHYEITFTRGNFMNKFATKAPAPNKAITDASAKVQSYLPTFVQGAMDKVDKVFTEAAHKAGGAAVEMAAGAIGGAIGGPGGALIGTQAAHMIMDVD